MAEGRKWQKTFKDSFSTASGDADESFCDPCKSEDKWVAVEGYCQICEEYLCENCLGVHRKQKLTRAHAILDKTRMPREQGTLRNQDLCVEVCKTHHPEIIRFYCKAHDEPGCGDCMTLNHTSCKKDRVQDISDGFPKTKEFKDTDQTLQQLYRGIEEMEYVLDNNLKNIDTTYNDILRKIKKVRKQINGYLDQIQKKITDEAAQMKKEDETELKTLHANNQAMKAEIEVMLKKIHDSNSNVNSLFVITKQAKQRLVTVQIEINKFKQLQQQQYEFLISNELEKIVSAKSPLGKLSRKYTQKTMITKKHDRRTPRTPSIDTEVAYTRSIDVKGEADKKTCWITDCTLLRPDRMVVIDQDNKNVKLIDISNNKVLSRYSTSSAPSKVTALTTNIIAITLPSVSKIQLLDVNTAFTLQREIKVSNACYGIAYKNGKFAVSYTNPARVEILDIQGQILHAIQPKQDKEEVLKQPMYIVFGQDNDTIIVSDHMTHKVSAVTFRGQILRTYTPDRLNDPRGIVITADGALLVCSRGSGCIHVVSPDFKTSKIIIKKDNYVVHPISITYCDINHRLYISNCDFSGGYHNYFIRVYDLNG